MCTELHFLVGGVVVGGDGLGRSYHCNGHSEKIIVTAEEVGVSCGGAAQVARCTRRVCPPRVVPQTRRRGAAVVFLGFYQPFKMLIVVDNFMYSCGQFTSQIIKRYCNVASQGNFRVAFDMEKKRKKKEENKE